VENPLRSPLQGCGARKMIESRLLNGPEWLERDKSGLGFMPNWMRKKLIERKGGRHHHVPIPGRRVVVFEILLKVF
jgi:hypothetical protein